MIPLNFLPEVRVLVRAKVRIICRLDKREDLEEQNCENEIDYDGVSIELDLATCPFADCHHC